MTEGAGRSPDHRSAEAAEYRKLYKRARWKALRSRQLNASPLCVMCEAEGKITAASVVDHIKPHQGDEALFHDPGNLQSLCKRHHDGAKQSIERRGYSKAVEASGWPSDPKHPANRVSVLARQQ